MTTVCCGETYFYTCKLWINYVRTRQLNIITSLAILRFSFKKNNYAPEKNVSVFGFRNCSYVFVHVCPLYKATSLPQERNQEICEVGGRRKRNPKCLCL